MGCGGPAAAVGGAGVDGDAVWVGQESKGGLCALTQEAGEGGDGPWVSAGIGPWEQLLQGEEKQKQCGKEGGGVFRDCRRWSGVGVKSAICILLCI